MKLNEAALKPEYVFITYDDVIRTAIPALYKALIKERSEYEDFINFDKIVDVSPYDLIKSIQARILYNPLPLLAKRKFEYDSTFMSITSSIHDIYKDSPDMVMGRTLHILAVQSFIKKIVIYNPYSGDNIVNDIKSFIRDGYDKITFANGSFIDAIKKSEEPISLYIVNDIAMANDIIDNAPTQSAEILVANYGYNYKLDDDNNPILRITDIDKKAENNKFRIHLFMPFFKESLIPKV